MERKNRIIDCHAHICDPLFDPDRGKMLERAQLTGVIAVISVSESMNDAERNIELASKHPVLRPTAGLYPTHLDLERAGEITVFIRKHRDKLIGIGEVGLDHWVVKETSEREIQAEIFKIFIHLSREFDLPLNVHSRSAGRHAVNMLIEQGARKVQLHAFDGKASNAMPAIEAGFFFFHTDVGCPLTPKTKACKTTATFQSLN
ncbi:TatD family hydrolase [Thermodesulfobacteriota bacterium]